MIKLDRPATPDFLKTNYKKWGKGFEERRLQNPNARFQWPKLRGQTTRINVALGELLREMTGDHCAYCDYAPLKPSGFQIDHFRPATLFPKLVCAWFNLFYCCQNCNSAKKTQFSRLLIKPDKTGYRFSDFFFFDTRTGRLEPHQKVSAVNFEMAKETCRVFGLNEFGRPSDRLNVFMDFQQAGLQGRPVSYRFMFS